MAGDISSESNDSSSDGEQSVDDLKDDATSNNSEWFTGDIESANDSEKQTPKENRHIDPICLPRMLLQLAILYLVMSIYC